jgi:HlyD family secretion protein
LQLQDELVFLRDLLNLLEKTDGIDANKATYKSNISSAINSINTVITAISTQQQAIQTQKTTNKNLITAAEMQITQAKNTLNLANGELEIKKSGSSKETIMAQEAIVKQTLASVQNVEAQIGKMQLVSPIDGTISQQDGDRGEIAPTGVPIISIISNAKYQVEVNIPEANIGQVKVGQTAEIKSDAFGDKGSFVAKIISVDPASTIVNSVSTYKANLEFLQEDELIKPGLTANTDIVISEKNDVLVVPVSSVFKNGETFVIVDNGTAKGEKREVEVGIIGNDGFIEILSGLTAGEKIAYFGEKK